MSKRLQLLLPDAEFQHLRAAAAASGTTMTEIVRAALRQTLVHTSATDPDRRIAAIRRAAALSFPAPDIDQMLDEIESGYLETGT